MLTQRNIINSTLKSLNIRLMLLKHLYLLNNFLRNLFQLKDYNCWREPKNFYCHRNWLSQILNYRIGFSPQMNTDNLMDGDSCQLKIQDLKRLYLVRVCES